MGIGTQNLLQECQQAFTERLDAATHLSVELENQSEHTVGGGMLRTKVD